MTKPIDPNYLASELRTAQRDALRLERRVQDLEAELADKVAQLADNAEDLLLKDRRIAELERCVQLAATHSASAMAMARWATAPAARGASPKVPKNVWTKERLIEIWRKHHDDKLSAAAIAAEYDRVKATPIIQQFLTGTYYTAAARAAYEELGVQVEYSAQSGGH